MRRTTSMTITLRRRRPLARAIARSVVVRAATLLAVLLAVPTGAFAVDNGPNFSGTVNCGDTSTSSTCAECCSGQPGCTIGKISCCPLSGDCTVTNKPSGGGGLPLKITEVVGGLKLQFQRKLSSDGADVKLKVSFLRGVFRKGLSLSVHLTGDDAQISGLLFPVVFLGAGSGAIDSLHGAGYDVAVTGTLPTCQSLVPDQLCAEAAGALVKTLYGALAVGNRVEAQQFVNGANGLGWGPCQIIG